MAQSNAAVLAIGDELLSGRTQDTNIHYLAGWLTERGVQLCEARIIGDVETEIVAALNELRARYDYVFTSGGIGPTHDDITMAAVAKAFDMPIEENPDAMALIEQWYSAKNEEVTLARRRMALMPKNARLILNSVSGAPGVKVGNVCVLAGVPRIFKAMLETLEGEIQGGDKVISCAVTAPGLGESKIAEQLGHLQSALIGVSLGSYPIDSDELGVTVVARSENAQAANAAIEAVSGIMRALGAEPQHNDRK